MTKQQQLSEELERLFTFAPPDKLYEEILYVFLNYLQREKESLPDNIQDIATDFYYLLKFLEKAGRIKAK